jgi:ABC-type branched-subunit amino acid transport system ATPase component
MPDVSLDHRRVSLHLAGISKIYGATRVVSEVDLSIDRSEVVALMGANGAGKSTLAKIASGVVQPDSGHILVGGREVKLAGPQSARSHGIFIVHQSTDQLGVPGLSVAENLVLDELCNGKIGRFTNRRRIRLRAQEIAANVGLELPLDRDFGELGPGHRQLIAVARAVATKASILIFDEPTASLGATEAARLFAVIDRLRTSGVGILYISHRLVGRRIRSAGSGYFQCLPDRRSGHHSFSRHARHALYLGERSTTGDERRTTHLSNYREFTGRLHLHRSGHAHRNPLPFLCRRSEHWRVFLAYPRYPIRAPSSRFWSKGWCRLVLRSANSALIGLGLYSERDRLWPSRDRFIFHGQSIRSVVRECVSPGCDRSHVYRNNAPPALTTERCWNNTRRPAPGHHHKWTSADRLEFLLATSRQGSPDLCRIGR